MTSSPLVRKPQPELVDVAKASGVSTGSIYGRVASKDDLLRAAHAREMDVVTELSRMITAYLGG